MEDVLIQFAEKYSLRVAKVCKSRRSRQEFSNKYSLAQIGFDAAENRPFSICWYLPPQSHEDRSEDVWLDRDAGGRSGEEEPANTTKARPPVAEKT